MSKKKSRKMADGTYPLFPARAAARLLHGLAPTLGASSTAAARGKWAEHPCWAKCKALPFSTVLAAANKATHTIQARRRAAVELAAGEVEAETGEHSGGGEESLESGQGQDEAELHEGEEAGVTD